jgi:ABC-type transporter Mla subunit MlaD
MSDGHEKLRQALEELQTRLNDLREIDPEAADQLDHSIANAQHVLAAAPEVSPEHQSVTESFHDALLQYEAAHPTLAGNLRSVIDALAQIGI